MSERTKIHVRIIKLFAQLLLILVQNFREFVNLLEERGVDMHRARISKAEIALWG